MGHTGRIVVLYLINVTLAVIYVISHVNPSRNLYRKLREPEPDLYGKSGKANENLKQQAK